MSVEAAEKKGSETVVEKKTLSNIWERLSESAEMSKGKEAMKEGFSGTSAIDCKAATDTRSNIC